MSSKWSRLSSILNSYLSHRYFNKTSCTTASKKPHPVFPKPHIASPFKNFINLFLFPPLKFISNDDVSSEISIADVEDNLSHILTLARFALEKGDTERAEAIIQMGLKVSEEHEVFLALPFMYDILITIAFATNDTEKAEGLLVDVVEKLAQIGTPENDHYIVDFKLRLARIYSADKKNDLAEIGFKTCLETQKQKLMDGDTTMRTGMLYVNCLFWFGIHKIRNERYREAKQMLDTAYDYSRLVLLIFNSSFL